MSGKRLDFELLAASGERALAGAVPPDADGLRGLAGRVAGFGEPVLAAVESMDGARFVHDQLGLRGWRVEIADALKVKGLAPFACKTDKIDAHVLAELCRRDLVPERSDRVHANRASGCDALFRPPEPSSRSVVAFGTLSRIRRSYRAAPVSGRRRRPPRRPRPRRSEGSERGRC